MYTLYSAESERERQRDSEKTFLVIMRVSGFFYVRECEVAQFDFRFRESDVNCYKLLQCNSYIYEVAQFDFRFCESDLNLLQIVTKMASVDQLVTDNCSFNKKLVDKFEQQFSNLVKDKLNYFLFVSQSDLDSSAFTMKDNFYIGIGI